ncbi:MAG: ABC transporter permease [Oligoflexia bacterium]|nr:ABC transporter permease [Oligoflexia bacterium]
MLFKLAWRNILRNKRRTVISSLAVGFGLTTLIFFEAFALGWIVDMIETATSTISGHAQIHREDFTDTYNVDLTINNSKNLLENLGREKDVVNFAPRVISLGIITSPRDIGSVMLFGIEPEKEKHVSKVEKSIIRGAFLPDNDNGTILIGKKLAKTLEAGVGEKVVVTVAQSKTGELSQDMFRIGGIFDLRTEEMDSGFAFINMTRAQKMLNIGDNIHEISIVFDDIDKASRPDFFFWERYSVNGNKAEGWNKIFPEVESMIKMTDFSIYITAVILFAIVAIGIINTLFMSLYERIFEFGVLKAIGTRSLDIVKLVLYESFWLSIVSAVFGIVLALLHHYIFSIIGINYIGLEFGGVTVQNLIYPVFKPWSYVIFPMIMIVFTLIVSLYPAIYASKLGPAKAIRKTM